MGSPFAPVVLPVIALAASLARWLMQDSHNIYTAVHKQFYVPDPVIEWTISPEHPVWLGLEICAVIAAIAVGLAVAGWIIRRREARRGQPSTLLRAAAWIVAIIPLAVPALAFASGGRPANARDIRPTAVAQSNARDAASGITGSLDAPAGRYEVVDSAGTTVTAQLKAGGEEFDAGFTGAHGSWTGDPHDLTKPVSAEISVDAATVDTGVEERSAHAKGAYLHADKFAKITLTIDRLIAANAESGGGVSFRAHGTLGLIGKTHSIELTGSLLKPDAPSLSRLKLTGDILLVKADFAVVIKETALASDAKDFDGAQIPIHVSLVMRHTSG